ncbi:putative Ig domain-containing protein, partial [Ketobacter sp.]
MTATDADSTVPTLSADVSGLPGNPSFSDWGDGSGRLNWTPPLNSPGTYTLVIRATDAVDSSLYSEQTVTITVETVPVTTGNFVYQES